MDPINYSVDVQTPFQAALQGYQAGSAIRNDQLAQQQQQLAIQQQQQQAKVIQSLITNPNASADDYANATMLIPGMKDQFKQAWDTKNAQQQQNDLAHISQVYGALQGGQPAVAATLLQQRAEALRASGNDADAKNAETMAGVAKEHPDFARSLIGMKLAAIPGGDKVITSASTLGTMPATVRKANADATAAEVTAGNAQTAADLENQTKEQGIKTAESQRQIAALNVQISQANSETERGRLTLERDKWTAELAKLQQTQTQAGQDSIDALTQGLQTIKSIEEHPGLKSNALGLGGVGSVSGKLSGLIPGTDRKDLEGLVDTLKSQQFLAGIKQMVGMGTLSNAEGEKIGAAVASLSMDQSPKAFMNALGVIKANMNKAQAKTIARGQAPTSGTTTPVIMTHPQFGQVRDADVNRLMLKYPGQTREQIVQFLRDTGGK